MSETTSETTTPVLRDDDRHLNLEQQKTRAKELHRALVQRNPAAIARVLARHPKAQGIDPQSWPDSLNRLSDAQLVIARELGLPSWPKLKAHIERMEQARRAIAAHAPPLDDSSTLHIRCGLDIRAALTSAGFIGQFLEISDPYCHGPVPRTEDLPAIRARFLADNYFVPFDETLALLRERDAELSRAPDKYARIVLWFEHDSHDQLILARVLAELAARSGPVIVELICIDRFPGITRFIGLGNLSPAALRTLWDSRKPVTSRQFRLGTAVWSALREPTPQALYAIASAGTPELPVMASALLRHLQELPWTKDGLSLTQRILLDLLGGGSRTVSALFRESLLRKEPLPFAGDLTIWTILRDMLRVKPTPFEIDAATAQQAWPHRRLSLTDTGKSLMSGELDWLSLKPPERWIGGVCLDGEGPIWRWANERKAIVYTAPAT